MIDLDTSADFSWSFDSEFFLQTVEGGNYIWSNPNYSGDNTIRKFEGSFKDWLKLNGLDYARSKGYHIIRNYCGDQVKFV